MRPEQEELIGPMDNWQTAEDDDACGAQGGLEKKAARRVEVDMRPYQANQFMAKHDIIQLMESLPAGPFCFVRRGSKYRWLEDPNGFTIIYTDETLVGGILTGLKNKELIELIGHTPGKGYNHAIWKRTGEWRRWMEWRRENGKS